MSGKNRVDFIGLVESSGDPSKLKILPEFCIGVEGLNRFSHIIVLYWFHLRDNEKDRHTLQVTPKRHFGAPQVGVFASRSPSRPTPIGMCIVELLKIEKCTLIVKGLDALKGSPIIDIKPYISRADAIPNAIAPEWTSHGPTT